MFLLLPWLALVATGCDGCTESKTYRFRNVPFCATEKPGVVPRLAEDYRIVIKHGGGFNVQGLRESGRRDEVTVRNDEVLFALVRCGARGRSLSMAETKALMEDFDESHVPSLCPGQAVVVHQRLEAKQDARSEGLGDGGYYEFPEAPLACAVGTLVREERYTLGDILDDFAESLEAYVRAHGGKLPGSPGAVEQATAAEPLPTDPWGQPLAFETTDWQLRLLSPGPDGKPATADDVEVMRYRTGEHSHILSFPGSAHSPYGEYRKQLAGSDPPPE